MCFKGEAFLYLQVIGCDSKVIFENKKKLRRPVVEDGEVYDLEDSTLPGTEAEIIQFRCPPSQEVQLLPVLGEKERSSDDL